MTLSPVKAAAIMLYAVVAESFILWLLHVSPASLSAIPVYKCYIVAIWNYSPFPKHTSNYLQMLTCPSGMPFCLCTPILTCQIPTQISKATFSMQCFLNLIQRYLLPLIQRDSCFLFCDFLEVQLHLVAPGTLCYIQWIIICPKSCEDVSM